MTIGPDQIRDLIVAALPDAQVACTDLTGTSDHWQVEIVSQEFAGKRLLQQHRLVKGALHTEIMNGTIHALTLTTRTP
jgi:stress-induced morphogen